MNELQMLKDFRYKYTKLHNGHVAMDFHKMIVDIENLTDENKQNFFFGRMNRCIDYFWYKNPEKFDEILFDITVSRETLYSLANRSNFKDIHGCKLEDYQEKDVNGYFCSVYVTNNYDVKLAIEDSETRYPVELTEAEKDRLFECANEYCKKTENMHIRDCFTRNPNEYLFMLNDEDYINFDISNKMQFVFRFCDREYRHFEVYIKENNDNFKIVYPEDIREFIGRFAEKDSPIDRACADFKDYVNEKCIEKYNEYKKSKKKNVQSKEQENYEYE